MSVFRITVMLLLLLQLGCTTSPTGRTQLMLLPNEAVELISAVSYLDTAEKLDAQKKLLNDPELSASVARITGSLVSVAIDRYPFSADWDWSVMLINDRQTVNAWCLPGGRMAVYLGIISKLRLTEDEFASLMGHEIAHAVAHHGTERMSLALVQSAGLFVIEKIFDDETGQAARELANLALTLPNSRDSEKEADRIGLELAALAGYDPHAAGSLWDKMARLDQESPSEFWSTHPAPEARSQKLRALAPEMAALNPGRVVSRIHPVAIIDGS